MFLINQALDDQARIIYGAHALEGVNDGIGRIAAKHCIEALAAELRAQLP